MRYYFLLVLIAASLMLAGAGEAVAKAGTTSKSSGSTLGSRGSRTTDTTPPQTFLAPPSAATSAQRGTAATPPAPLAAPRSGSVDAQPLQPTGARPLASPGYAAPQAGMAAGMAAPTAQPGFLQRNPFLAGLAGGVLGAGIGSMLFGHNPALAAATDAAPGAGILGLMIQVALIGALVWLAFKLFRGRAPMPAGNPYARTGASPLGRMGDNTHQPRQPVEPRLSPLPLSAAAPVEPAVAPAPREFEPTEADQQAFTTILLGVQQAWSQGDIEALRRWTTPDMAVALERDLLSNAADGLINRVENVALREGAVTESWREQGLEFLTARLVFDCQDYMMRRDGQMVVSGSRAETVRHAELWTFVRPLAGGAWRLSAIQPAG